jgi:phage terminase large subunit-like protein
MSESFEELAQRVSAEAPPWPTEVLETREAAQPSEGALLHEVSLEEVVRLGGRHTAMFAHSFFPKTFRQEDPPFDDEIWAVLDDPRYRFVNIQSFRDSGKTTKLRTFIAKRVAYGVSKTILYLGASESKALRSVNWLRMAVQNNALFATTFGLRPGLKWQEHEAQIFRETENETAWIVGLGITSQDIRGLNFDDYRPDLIVLDDCITDENASSVDQREKITDLIYGAIVPGLAPRSEAPLAKIVMLQTPLNADDASGRAARSSQWKTISIGCWTPETADLPTEQQQSAWPARHTSEELRESKRQAIRDNRYSVWSREYQVKIIASEKCSFKIEWLRYFSGAAPAGPTYVVIDPVPPPSDVQIAKNLLTKDFEAIGAIRRVGGKYYFLEHRTNRGHEPNWTVATAFELAEKYSATGIIAEATAYQRALLYILRNEMQRKQRYWALIPFDNRNKSKYLRITGVLSGPLSNGAVYARDHMTDLREQLEQYPGVKNDDIIDMYSMGLEFLSRPAQEVGAQQSDVYDLEPENYEEIQERFLQRSP